MTTKVYFTADHDGRYHNCCGVETLAFISLITYRVVPPENTDKFAEAIKEVMLTPRFYACRIPSGFDKLEKMLTERGFEPLQTFNGKTTWIRNPEDK